MKPIIAILTFTMILLPSCSKTTVRHRTSTSASPADISTQKIEEESLTSVNAQFTLETETYTAAQDTELNSMECIRPVYVQSRLDAGKVEGVDFVIDDTIPTFSRFDEGLNKYVTEHPIVDPIPTIDGGVTYEVYAAARDTKCGSRDLVGLCSLYNLGHSGRMHQFNLDKASGLIDEDAVFPVPNKFISSGWQNCLTPNSNSTDMYEQIFKEFVLNAEVGDDISFQMILRDGAGNASVKSYNFRKLETFID